MTKKAGRPTGTGIKDGHYLDQIADALIRDPDRKVNNIIMALDSTEDPENLRRRLHRKWKAQGPERLPEARERHEERNRKATRKPAGPALRGVMDNLASYQTATQALQNALDNPTVRALRSLEDSPTMRAMRALQDHPATKMMQDMERMQRLADPFNDLRRSGVLRGILDD